MQIEGRNKKFKWKEEEREVGSIKCEGKKARMREIEKKEFKKRGWKIRKEWKKRKRKRKGNEIEQRKAERKETHEGWRREEMKGGRERNRWRDRIKEERNEWNSDGGRRERMQERKTMKEKNEKGKENQNK